MVLLVVALALFVSLIASGAWLMLRLEATFAEPDGSVLSQCVAAREERRTA